MLVLLVALKHLWLRSQKECIKYGCVEADGHHRKREWKRAQVQVLLNHLCRPETCNTPLYT
eukprot:scaffold175_cov414-Prasinococcus_capsulatus_cf.AAC.21